MLFAMVECTANNAPISRDGDGRRGCQASNDCTKTARLLRASMAPSARMTSVFTTLLGSGHDYVRQCSILKSDREVLDSERAAKAPMVVLPSRREKIYWSRSRFVQFFLR